MIDTTRRTAETYQLAMERSPQARRDEFLLPLRLAELQPGESLVDFPSGGGYLREHIDSLVPGVEYCPVENVAGYKPSNHAIRHGEWEHLPFTDNGVDVIFTLAAIHHLLDNRDTFYRECHRVLKTRSGRLIIADVLADTPQAHFLNEFVDTYSSQGHRGIFINQQDDCARLESGGLFKVAAFRHVKFDWQFASEEEMVYFSKNLFRLDLASDDIILDAARKYLDAHQTSDGFAFRWELALIRADKQVTA